MDWPALIALQAIACGGFCYTLAKAKGHGGWSWFFAGLFFSIVGVIAAAGLPDLRVHDLLESLRQPSGMADKLGISEGKR